MSKKNKEDPKWLYGFAVARVQSYLLSSPRLRDIQGGSELLEKLCGEEFLKAVAASGLSEEREPISAAGAARIGSDNKEALQKLYAAWPAIADSLAPNAEVYQALVDVQECGGLVLAHQVLGDRLHKARVAPMCHLPVAGPLVERDQRTGLPAETTRKRGQRQERVDRATEAKEGAWEELRIEGRRGLGELDKRCLGDLAGSYRFVTGADENAEGLTSEDDPYVGVIHLDGNAVGRFIEQYVGNKDGDSQRFRKFSEALTNATCAAVADAVKSVLVPHSVSIHGQPVLPARPVLVGGDDVTIIVKAKLAIEFSEVMIERFEHHTKEQFNKAKLGAGTSGLSACAGIALVKKGFPFDRAHHLAESLCKQAKNQAKNSNGGVSQAVDASEVPGGIAFHRVTSSLPTDAQTVLADELTGSGAQITFEAYRVGDRVSEKFASLAALRDLARALPFKGQRGAIRGLLNELPEGGAAADKAYERMCDMTKRHDRNSGQAQVDRIEVALEVLTGGGLWREDKTLGKKRTPIHDAYILRLACGEESTP